MSYYNKYMGLFAANVAGPTIDYAADYIAAVEGAGITLSTVKKDAIIAFTSGLVSSGIMDATDCIYPFLSGSSVGDKFNLKDPRDLDAAYRLTYTGAASTHTDTGVVWSGYADTHWIPSSRISNPNYGFTSIYLRTSNSNTEYDFGSRGTISNNTTALVHVEDGLYMPVNTSLEVIHTISDKKGFLMANRTSANLQLWHNGVNVANRYEVYGASDTSVHINGMNNNGVRTGSTTKEHALLMLGNAGILDGQAATLNTLVTNFQTALSRNV